MNERKTELVFTVSFSSPTDAEPTDEEQEIEVAPAWELDRNLGFPPSDVY